MLIFFSHVFRWMSMRLPMEVDMRQVDSIPNLSYRLADARSIQRLIMFFHVHVDIEG